MIQFVQEQIIALFNTCTIPENCLSDYPQIFKYFEKNNIKLDSIRFTNEIFQSKDKPLKLFVDVISFFQENKILKSSPDLFVILEQQDPQMQKSIKNFFKLWIVLIKAQKNYQDKQKPSQDIQMKNTQKSETLEKDDKIRFDINFNENNEEIQEFLDHINKAFIEYKKNLLSPHWDFKEDLVNYSDISNFQYQDEEQQLYQEKESLDNYEGLQKSQFLNCWALE